MIEEYYTMLFLKSKEETMSRHGLLAFRIALRMPVRSYVSGFWSSVFLLVLRIPLFPAFGLKLAV